LKTVVSGRLRKKRYPASDKLEIIRLVENSHLGVKRTLAQKEDETDEKWKKRCRTASQKLSDRASNRCNRYLSLEGYASKRQGKRGATLWHLPAQSDGEFGSTSADAA
jgi:hypothetical protein